MYECTGRPGDRDDNQSPTPAGRFFGYPEAPLGTTWTIREGLRVLRRIRAQSSRSSTILTRRPGCGW